MQLAGSATFNGAVMVLAVYLLVVPLVSGLFIDISNSLVIQGFLEWIS